MVEAARQPLRAADAVRGRPDFAGRPARAGKRRGLPAQRDERRVGARGRVQRVVQHRAHPAVAAVPGVTWRLSLPRDQGQPQLRRALPPRVARRAGDPAWKNAASTPWTERYGRISATICACVCREIRARGVALLFLIGVHAGNPGVWAPDFLIEGELCPQLTCGLVGFVGKGSRLGVVFA